MVGAEKDDVLSLAFGANSGDLASSRGALKEREGVFVLQYTIFGILVRYSVIAVLFAKLRIGERGV